MLAFNRGQAYFDSSDKRLKGGLACVDRMQNQVRMQWGFGSLPLSVCLSVCLSVGVSMPLMVNVFVVYVDSLDRPCCLPLCVPGCFPRKNNVFCTIRSERLILCGCCYADRAESPRSARSCHPYVLDMHPFFPVRKQILDYITLICLSPKTWVQI